MGARELLLDLAGAGLTVALTSGKIIVAPKDRLTDPLRDAIRATRAELVAALSPVLPSPARTCADCLHRLPKYGTCGEPVAAGLATKFEVVWAEQGNATGCKAFTVKMPSKAPGEAVAGLYRLSAADADRCHSPAWDDVEISTFEARVMLLRLRAMTAPDANELAEQLTLRDRDGDDRRLCLECVRLDGRGRCLAAAAGELPGADRHLEPVTTILQRCPAFGLRKGLL